MTSIDPDNDLRDLFARLKQEDRARAPSFKAVRSRPVRRHGAPSRRALGVAAGVAAAAILITALSIMEHRRQSAASRQAPPNLLARSSWASPTDFLLQTPGSEMLRTIPSFQARWITPDTADVPPRNRS
jgi:hypothetical protein